MNLPDVNNLPELTNDELLQYKSILSDESEQEKDNPVLDEQVRLEIWAVDVELEQRGYLGGDK